MPATSPLPDAAARRQLGLIGERIRAQRKAQRINAATAAQAAGMSRVTLHRIEGGEASVTMGAYLNAAAALGLEIGVVTPQEGQQNAAAKPAQVASPPAAVRLADYPQLRRLAWHIQGIDALTPKEALNLYERNWRHVDQDAMDPKEKALLKSLVQHVGGGHLLV